MLTNSSVLESVKFNLGHPFTEIELLDNDIIYRCREIVLKRYFSKYVPVYKFQLINTGNVDHRTEYKNRFKILDPDNAGILSVYDVITKNEILMSLNLMGSMDLPYSELPNWYAQYNDRRTSMLTTAWYSIFEFIHPIYIEIRPEMTIGEQFMACYEAQHSSFETIPAYRESLFLDLVNGYIMMNISRIRMKFTTLETVFGNIQLNWEEYKAEGKELWDNTIMKLEKIPPRVIVDIG